MKRLNLFIVVVLMALVWSFLPPIEVLQARAAPAFVNGAAQFSGADAATIVSTAASQTAGNTLIVSTRSTSGATVTSMTDTAGNTFMRIAREPYTTGGSMIEMWAAYDTLGHATNQVTVTYSASNSNRAVNHVQFSGLAEVSALEAVADIEGVVTSLTTPTMWTTVADGVIVSFAQIDDTGRTWTPDTGYTSGAQDASTVTFTQYKIVSALQVGVTTTAAVSGGAGTVRMITAAFNAPVSGSGPGHSSSIGELAANLRLFFVPQ
jgi:hypothetical protein